MFVEPSIKYPRTHHLPWSDTIGPDGDHVLEDVSAFEGREVIVTEKLDGENTTLYRSHLHARSVDGRHHPSRDWVKGWHARVAPHIPSGFRLCGENLFALHSIAYTALPSYLLVFSVFEGETCLSWDDTVAFCELLESSSGQPVPLVPVLYRGPWDQKQVHACHTGDSRFGAEQEGYVVRVSSAIELEEWHRRIAKYVRPNHVQTGRHWMFSLVEKNGLAK
jgi:hypothetical protein